MRFGLVHRLMTDALATLGVLAVISAAQGIPAVTRIGLLVGLVLALCVPESWQAKPAMRHFATIAPLTLFVVQGLRLLTQSPPIAVAVEFAALLQIIRLGTRRGAAHDQQVIVLALLHFVAGTVLGGSLTYGLCFVGFLIVAPGALVLSHLRREVEGNYRQGARDRTGLPVDVPRILRSRRVVGKGFLAATCFLALPILLFTAILFILFPRVGLSLLLLNNPNQDRMTGYADKVNLGDVGVLRSNSAIALRLEIKDLPEPPPKRLTFHLRGTAFDDWDGSAWHRTDKERRPAERVAGVPDVFPVTRAPDPLRDRRISIDLEPIDPPVVFLPARTSAIQLKLPGQSILGDPLILTRGPEGEFRYGGSDTRGLHYDVFVADEKDVTTELLPATDRTRYLAVPSSIPARVGDLAHQWTDGLATPLEKARAIQEHLRTEFKYDLGSPSAGTDQPVDHFLFESLRGHCEFFSTAMAVMLRQVGIPSRNVTGFVGGTYNRFGSYYAVRQGDAHSWVEAYIDGGSGASRGAWQTFDPTPPSGSAPVDSSTGPLNFLRDVFEALTQRWNKYVVGYDLRTQIKLFDDVSRRYDNLRSKAGVDKGVLGGLTQGPVLAALAIVLAMSGYLLWKRRRQKRNAAATDPRKPRPDPKVESAAALYRSLESALAVHGLTRPISLPPLRHAEEVCAKHHALGTEILDLTNVYLAARFGGLALSDGDRKDFERRVKEIKGYRPPPVKADAHAP